MDDFQAKWPFSNGHFNTFSPYLSPLRFKVAYTRKRISTEDGDFIDLDFIVGGHTRLMILCHGLEGSSDSSYVRLFASKFKRDYDVLAMNYRGCSEQMNHTMTMYNSGTTEDLHHVIKSCQEDYDEIVLVGFSLGGNLILKYLGEKKFPLLDKIKASIAISTPLHLSDASQKLLKPENYLYQLKFLRSLRQKIKLKNAQFPNDISLAPFKYIKNLYDFDQYYTAPMFGYRDAEDYYAKNQAIQFLSKIETPSLIISSKDDPFLGPKCYPLPDSYDPNYLHFNYTTGGGHVGFMSSFIRRDWLIHQTKRFLDSLT